MTVPIDYVYKHKRRTFSATLYSAALRFTVEGKEYQMHFNIGKDAFESFAPGDSIRINVPLIHPQYATLVENKLVKATP